MVFSTDLATEALRIPHHQVRETPSAVPEVSSQAPAHTTEDRAPEAGDKILNVIQKESYPPQEQRPQDRLARPSEDTRTIQQNSRNTRSSSAAGRTPQVSSGEELFVVSYHLCLVWTS